MLRNCPDCGTSILKTAKKCRCGWTVSLSAVPAAERPHIACDGTPGCSECATLRIGDKNLCNGCYVKLPRPVPDYSNNPTVQEVRKVFERSRYAERVRQVGVDIAKAEAMREPGQDDEERRSA